MALDRVGRQEGIVGSRREVGQVVLARLLADRGARSAVQRENRHIAGEAQAGQVGGSCRHGWQ